MNRAVKNFNNLLNISFLMIALDVLVGCFLIFYTDIATTVATVVSGCLVLVHGIFALIDYFYVGMFFNFMKYRFIPGILLALLGIVMIISPTYFISLLGVGIGIWLLSVGVESLFYSYRLWQNKEEIYTLILFIGLCSLVMGVLTVINPFSRFMLLPKLVGIFVVANGILNIVQILLFKKRSKNIIKVFK